MQTVGQIIRNRREALGLTLRKLAEAVGTTKSYLSMIENHRVANPPSQQILVALERAMDITDGELIRAAQWQNTPERVKRAFIDAVAQRDQGQQLARKLKALTRKRKGQANNLDEMMKSGELRKLINDVLKKPEGTVTAGKGDESGIDEAVPIRYRIPIINSVAAGYPTDFTDLDYPARIADSYVDCPDITDAQAFAARVVGESMAPDYREGDIVVFSPSAELSDGCDAFVRLEPDHETTFKRVYFENEYAPGGKWPEEDKDEEGRIIVRVVEGGDRGRKFKKGSDSNSSAPSLHRGDHTHIRLQPLNAKFPPRTVPRADVAGLYRAVWKMSPL